MTQIHQLKITLRESKPPIWRRFLIASDVTLARLHQVLQDVMGWHDSHLYEFEKAGVSYGSPDPEFTPGRKSDRTTKLSQVLRRPKDRLVYLYDFGDGWEHDVLLEDVLASEPRVKYPRCVAGKRACPPEDCGGLPGYEHYLEAISNPKHPEHADMIEWNGEGFDPEAFEIAEVNGLLRPTRAVRRGPA